MVDNKKVAKTAEESAAADAKARSDVETNKATATQPNADKGTVVRTPQSSPAETVLAPTVAEVKNPSLPTKAQDNIDAHVEATRKSVDAANKANEVVASAKPFEKSEEKYAKAPTPDERLKDSIERVGRSVQEYNKSAAEVEKAANSGSGVNTKREESRVAPLSGELRVDPEDDSYITPGKILAPVDPKPGEAPLPEPPLVIVIAPLTGEIKPMDETSYPTPGHVRNSDALVSDSVLKKFALDNKSSDFGTPMGHQVSLLRANEEMWKNDQAAVEDSKARAAMIAEALVSSDGLRRTRRAQKNLR